MASSRARRVPDPIEKWAVWAASPTRTTSCSPALGGFTCLPLATRQCHDRLRTVTKVRHSDSLDRSRCSPSQGAKRSWQKARLSASLIVSSPAERHAASGDSTMNVLRWAS